MPNSRKSMPWTEMRTLVGGWIGFVGNYVNFITKVKPDLKNHVLTSELYLLEKKITTATGPFLTYEQTIKMQNKIYPLILDWNVSIGRQVSDFYNLTTEIARLTAKANAPTSSYNPFELIEENEKKFILAAGLVTGIFYSVPEKPTAIDLLAMFYGLISTTETTHHYLFEQFKKSIKLFGLEEKYDIYSMFSINSKLKNQKGQYQTDIRAIRNALSHFNFKLIEEKNSKSNIVITLDSCDDKSKVLTFSEFRDFYFNGVFLLNTFLAILYWHAAFATLRHNFVKKKKCPKCKKGHLNVRYTNEIYETKKDPTLCTFWICDKCNMHLPYKFNKK